jgi:hypothetical protein
MSNRPDCVYLTYGLVGASWLAAAQGVRWLLETFGEESLGD